ncbi:MAG: DUF445 family protein [Lentisphaeria bacterium]|nr:DUF445 family protein [Lentisphaeria bacterium]
MYEIKKEETKADKLANVAKIADRCCKWASCIIAATIILLFVVQIMPLTDRLPDWLTTGSWIKKYAIPILASAAVGYGTNWFAIWLLFRPYEKHFGFLQGVIPRQKKSFGHELGILIPQHLLQPEKISVQIGKIALKYLKDKAFIQKIRDYVNVLLLKNSTKLTGVVLPYVRDLSIQAIQETATPEKFKQFCRFVTEQFLKDADTRIKTVQFVVVLFKEVMPQLSDDLKETVAERVAESFRKEHGIINWFKEKFSTSVKDDVKDFWEKGERELLESLERKETQEQIAKYFSDALTMFRNWLERPANTGAIERFLQEWRQYAEEYVGQYLEEKLPSLADDLLSSDLFWKMLEEKALPTVQFYVVKQLRGGRGSLLEKIDIPGKIEKAVDNMDMKQLHEFILQASNNNLTILQVLGFVLGAVAGFFMAFVI